MGRKQREKLLQFVDDLVANGAAVITGMLGVGDAAAREAATELARRMCAQYARSYMYVPTDIDFELSDRDKEIWRKYGEVGPGQHGARPYTRDRVDELAVEYSITSTQIYNIIRLMRKLELAQRQGTLPGFEPPGN